MTLGEKRVKQRVLNLAKNTAALILEEGNQELCYSKNEDPRFDAYGSHFEMERDMETDTFCSPRSQNRDIRGERERPTLLGVGVKEKKIFFLFILFYSSFYFVVVFYLSFLKWKI